MLCQRALGAVLGVLDQPLDAPIELPVGLPLLGDDARRRAAHRELLAETIEVDALVAALVVDGGLAPEALHRDLVELARELEDADAAEAREQRLAVDVPPELQPLLEAPSLDEIPRPVEAVLRVADALH